ncbi:hypothetical protein PENTCL1PPCAC_6809, partial [Pristionchus entomophagus]
LSFLTMSSVDESELLPIGPSNGEYDGVPQDDLIFINGLPCYTDKHKLRDGEIQVFERIGYDDRVGATYLVMAGDKELVLRVGTDKSGIVALEKVFLHKVESRGLWPHFSQLHSAWQTDRLDFMAVYFRQGPSLPQCLDFLPSSTFSLGTLARLGKDILTSLRHIHGIGYVARCLNKDLFHLCAASRHLFMADISNIRLDPTSIGHAAAPWTGGSLLAPLPSHEKGVGLARGDELESWLYLMVLLYTGSLPWDSVYDDQVEVVKRSWNVVEGLGEKWEQLKQLVFAQSGVQIVPDAKYEEIGSILDEMAKEGGVEDEDHNYDFEVEPNEADLPKFILEKRPVNGPIEEKEEEEEETVQMAAP